jgi:hypothetical protein
MASQYPAQIGNLYVGRQRQSSCCFVFCFFSKAYLLLLIFKYAQLLPHLAWEWTTRYGRYGVIFTFAYIASPEVLLVFVFGVVLVYVLFFRLALPCLAFSSLLFVLVFGL